MISKDRYNEYIKPGLIYLAIGIAMIVLHFPFGKFWLLGEGILICIFATVYLLYACFSKSAPQYGCNIAGLCSLTICAFVICNYFVWGGTRYISQSGEKQHRYENCRSLQNSKNIKKVGEFEGFFHGCYEECKICNERYEKELEEKRKQREVEREEKEETHRQALTNKLLKYILRLNNGEDPEIIEAELENEYSNCEDEYDDSDSYVPGRYR